MNSIITVQAKNSNPGDRETKIYPLAWLLIAALAMVLLDRNVPVDAIIRNPLNRAGYLLLVPGLLMVLAAGASFMRRKTGLLPFSETKVLVTGGLFRFSRNPMYLGMVLFLLGEAVLLGSLTAFVPVPVFAWIIDRQFIRREEQLLSRQFGDSYREYCDRVRRWI